MNIKILNWIVFGTLMLIVFVGWCLTAIAIVIAPMVGVLCCLLAIMATQSWIRFIKESLRIQELNRREKEEKK